MDWKSIVGTVAPWLGAALGGPLGSAAVTIIADSLGLSDRTESAIKIALGAATPEQMMSIKTADQDFAIQMQALGFANERDMEALAAGDRDSARKREMIVQDGTTRYLAYALTFGFFGVLVFIMLGDVAEGMREVLYIMLGALGASWQSCINYYFGSSSGSQTKTSLLAKAEAIKSSDL